MNLPLRRIDDLKQNQRVRKGLFVLPSLFTAANIAAGYYAISQSILAVNGEHWHFDMAARAIGFAVIFDGLDGRIARLTNSTSEFGKELDSLADVITFGVAPAVLAFMWGVNFTSIPFENWEARVKLIQISGFITFLFLVACASRLARFNVQANPQPSNPGRPGRKYFVGMPTPAGAGVIAAVVHLSKGDPLRVWWHSAIWVALVFVIGYLMVSTWRYYSFKDIDFKKMKPYTSFVLIASLVFLIWQFSHQVLFLMAMTYLLSGVLARLSFVFRQTPRTAEPATTE